MDLSTPLIIRPTCKDKYVYLDQEDDFYQDGSATSMSGAAENSIWHILCRECDVTEEQKSRIV